ncbi:hypothetical protein [Streptomyces longisporoflavus]|uniref:Uncharacterized protein n=1 Tax=Streptomyces longisporoflavus TaxID=28044 RepID=A0ABW7R0K1_9ACTN
MYPSPAPLQAAGLGGASLLASGFDALAAVVAATTLLMACVAAARLYPRKTR